MWRQCLVIAAGFAGAAVAGVAHLETTQIVLDDVDRRHPSPNPEIGFPSEEFIEAMLGMCCLLPAPMFVGFIITWYGVSRLLPLGPARLER